MEEEDDVLKKVICEVLEVVKDSKSVDNNKLVEISNKLNQSNIKKLKKISAQLKYVYNRFSFILPFLGNLNYPICYPLTLFHELGHGVFDFLSTGFFGKIYYFPGEGGIYTLGGENVRIPSFYDYLKEFHPDCPPEIFDILENNFPSDGKIIDEYFRLKDLYLDYKIDLLDSMYKYSEQELGLIYLGGPIFDVISGVLLMLIIKKLKKENPEIAKFLAMSYVLYTGNLILYSFNKTGDYSFITQSAGVPLLLVSLIFSGIFSGIALLSFYFAFSKKDKLEKELKEQIKKYEIKYEKNKKTAPPDKIYKQWNKEYDLSIKTYIFYYIFKMNPSHLNKNKTKDFDKEQFFDETVNFKQLKDLVFEDLIGFKEIVDGKRKINLTCPSVLEHDLLNELEKLVLKLTKVFEEVFYLKSNDEFFNYIETLRIQMCNTFLKRKYGLNFSEKQEKKNQLMLEMLSIKELLKYENSDTLNIKLGQLIKADTEIFMLFNSLLEVVFEEELFDINNFVIPLTCFGFSWKSKKIRKINQIIYRINLILESIPGKIQHFFKKNPDYVKKMEEIAKNKGIIDFNPNFVKKIDKLSPLTNFDFMRIISRVNDDTFLDYQYNVNYAKVLTDCVINKGNDFYFLNRKQLEKEFNINYKSLKQNWKEFIRLNKSFFNELFHEANNTLPKVKKEFKNFVGKEKFGLFNDFFE